MDEEDAIVIHTDYIFLTLKSKGLRVAVGNRKGNSSIVYTYSINSSEEDEYYSYRVYLDALTEEEGQSLQKLVVEKQTRKAHSYLSESIRLDNCIGPCGPVELSDQIPDSWFDGCKSVISILSQPKNVGIYTIDFETEDSDFGE